MKLPPTIYTGTGVLSTYPRRKIPVEREDLENTFLWISEFTLEKRRSNYLFFSDGVSQSGMGTAKNALWLGKTGQRIYCKPGKSI